MNLAAWARRVLKEVDGDGGVTARIRLVTGDGSMWEGWEPPFPSPEDWVQEADALVAELSAEWPPKKVQVMFVAEDATGAIRSQCPKTVIGKNRGAADMFGSESRALSASMEAQAQTTERLLASSNVQIGILTKTVETLGEQVHGLLEYICQREENEALKRSQTGNGELGELFKNAMESVPVLVTMLDDAKKRKHAARSNGGNGKAKQIAPGSPATGKLPAVKEN